MKNIFLFLCLLPLFSVAQVKPKAKTAAAPVAAKGFVIKGEINGVAKGTEIKLISANNSAELAHAVVIDKKVTTNQKGKMVTTLKKVFELKGSLAEPELCVLSVGDLKPYNLFVENKTITIKGDYATMNNWVITGSPSHQDFMSFEKIFTPLAQGLNSSASIINATGPGNQRDSLMAIHETKKQNIQNEIDTFINRRTSSYVSPFVLLVLMGFNDDPILAEARFAKLTAPVQESYLGKALSSQIANSKIGAVGTQALEFSQADTAGQMVSLSSFRGKYVLVDFWASWCGPCRQENPNVVSNFNRFKDKNFTVLGVSLDRPGQKDKWIQAIQMDSLTWTHVSDLQFWQNAVAKMYHIEGIPQNILVDPQGKIVGRNLRGAALEEKLCEILGCN